MSSLNSITIKPNFSSLDIPENGFGYFFPANNFLCGKNTRTKFHVYGKRENAYQRQPANVKNGGKIMVTWSLLPFAFHVNVMLYREIKHRVNVKQQTRNCGLMLVIKA